MNFLETILAHKRDEIRKARKHISEEELKSRALYCRQTLSLSDALRSSRPAVIAEVKKASPSKGIIRQEFNPVQIAGQYVQGGANALSVLTDERFFQGELSFLEAIRNVVSIPLLRKDFIVESYQLHEAKAFGADATLLIAAALEPGKLADLASEAKEIGLECLVEVHTEEELRSLDAEVVKIIGINNRDLVSFQTDLATTFRLIAHVPANVIIVSESGIAGADDVKKLIQSGVDAVLIGEQLMRAADPGAMLANLLKGVRS